MVIEGKRRGLRIEIHSNEQGLLVHPLAAE